MCVDADIAYCYVPVRAADLLAAGNHCSFTVMSDTFLLFVSYVTSTDNVTFF